MRNKLFAGILCICVLLLARGCSSDAKVEAQSEDEVETVPLSEYNQEEETQVRDYYEELIGAARAYILKNRDGKTPENYEFSDYVTRTSLGYVVQCSLKRDGKVLADYDFSYIIMKSGDYGIPGYLIEDIDGNGIDELIFGGNGTSADGTRAGIICDIYTISDGKLVHVLSGWERNRYYFCENGTVANEGSSGAADSDYSYFNLEGSELHLVESVIYDGIKDADNPWFYSTGPERDAANAEPISEERAMEIREKYVYEHPAFIPFAEDNQQKHGTD